MVAAALEDTGLAAHRLELEITETLLLGDTEAIMTELQTLKATGVSIVMDDFGTGHSSLTYLKRLPLSQRRLRRALPSPLRQSQHMLHRVASAQLPRPRCL